MSLYFYYYILFAYNYIHSCQSRRERLNMCGKTQQFTILLLVVKLLLLKLLVQKVFDQQVSFVILQHILAKLL